ncbi:DUF58 domain-containing protein [Planctomycetota bacterium]|nr:DUF58 domain-containing protein [Planctomycetota bacterium]
MKRRTLIRFARLSRKLAVLPLPTRLGLYFIGAGVMMFIAGSVYDHKSFILLACLPLALVFVNSVICWLNIRNIEFKRRMQHDTHVGERVPAALMVHNAGRLPSFGLELDDTLQPEFIRQEVSNIVMMISPGFVGTTNYDISFMRRGWQRLQRLVVSSAFPFGLMRQSKTLEFTSEILVYPRPVKLSTALRRKLLESAQYFGESAITSRGEDEIFGIRDYLPGHSISRIHWKTTARINKPMVLEMEGRQDASFVLMLDTSAVGDRTTLGRRLEAAISLAAGIVYFLNRQNVMFRFAWHGPELEVSQPGRGERHYHGVMQRLATAGYSDAGLGEWVNEIGLGQRGEVPILITLGNKEHAEARMRNHSGAIVIGASDNDFRDYLLIDAIGRRAVSSNELKRGGDNA